jgi:hypothetical protein
VRRKNILLLLLLIAVWLLNCENNSTKPEPVELTLLTPVGGEIWFLHGDVDITWSSKNGGSTIKIEISRDGGESWEHIAESTNTGNFTWAVSGDESDTVLVRLTDVESGKTATLASPLQIKALGYLDVNFYLEYVADPYPTYQTVMWLENENGTYLKSLFVSDWLARGGYNSTYVCSTWSSKAQWDNETEEDIDAVTAATPDWGVDSFYTFDLSGRTIAPGVYKFNIETHITGDYNILYSADIEFRGEDTTTEPTPVYSPGQHPQAGVVLTNVKIEYVFNRTTD